MLAPALTGFLDILEARLKSSPIDFRQFRQETSVKYPTFSPAKTGEAGVEQIATAIMPIPVRQALHHSMMDDETGGLIPQRQSSQMPQQLPPTPAPSPPPNNARLKKEKYQTDPNRPFLFPFSRLSGAPVKLVPFAIDEADRLYRRHMHISLAIYQMWQTREQCMLDESGVDPLSSEGLAHLDKESSMLFGNSIKQPLALPPVQPDGDESPENLLPDVRRLDFAIAEAQAELDKAEKAGDRALKRKLKERRDDLVRLRRVESLYVCRSNRNNPIPFSTSLYTIGICASACQCMGTRRSTNCLEYSSIGTAWSWRLERHQSNSIHKSCCW